MKDGKLDETVMDPSQIAFGYGRRYFHIRHPLPKWTHVTRLTWIGRICPGRFFAEASIFVMLSNILHTFVIEAPTDATGRPVYNPVEMTYGVIS